MAAGPLAKMLTLPASGPLFITYAPVFTGAAWNQVPPGLRAVPKKPKKPNRGRNGSNPFGFPPQGPVNPTPFPTFSCDPTLVTCATGNTQGQQGNGFPAGAAVGGIFVGLPATCLWVRRRGMRKRRQKRG